MLTISRVLILMLGHALLAGSACADDFMLGAAPGGAVLAQSRQDCDIAPSEPAPARVIYHDGQRAPVSVPVESRTVVGDDVTTPDATAATESTGTAGTAAAVSLPSAEPAVPQKPRGGGLRWQSVLPGSIK
jgi:hypothetical protein